MLNSCLSVFLSFSTSTAPHSPQSVMDGKSLKGKGMKALVSLLEGRTDVQVHETLADKLEISLLRKRMVHIHQSFMQLKDDMRVTLGDDDWDEEFLDEVHVHVHAGPG